MYRTDHYGGDIEGVPANNFEECRKICEEYSTCKRWTYQYSRNGACLLKNENIEEVLHSNRKDKICFNCKTGFKNSSNITCAEKGKKCSQIEFVNRKPYDLNSILGM